MEIGGKGLFTKEIEEALLDGRIDCAVHSMKDMPTWLPEGLVIGAMLRARGCARRAVRQGRHAHRGAAAGRHRRHRVAAAARRSCCPAGLTSKIVPLRGNVETRLRKLAAGEADATLLAVAGLKRLGLLDKATRSSIATRSCRRSDRAPSASRSAPAIAVAARCWRRSITARRAVRDAAERVLPGRARRLLPYADRGLSPRSRLMAARCACAL